MDARNAWKLDVEGQSDKAHTELSTAIAMYQDMEMTFRLPETEAALADLENR